MKPHIFLSLLLFLITGVRSVAQQTSDPKQAELLASARLKTMTQVEFKELAAKARTGDAEAQFWIGRAYDDGRLVPKDSGEAMQWFLKSAEQGYLPALRMYGLASLSINRAVGERWMRRAGAQGDAAAQFCLGWAYEEDWFGTIDSQEALKWYRKSAEGGHPDAQVELGRRYEEGEGVEKNYALAAKWYRIAAEHVPNLGGAGQGSYRLGLLYMEGLGVPQDFTQAYFWFSLHGNAEVNASDAREHLTPAQIREVERLLKQWKEQHRLDPALAAALHIEN